MAKQTARLVPPFLCALLPAMLLAQEPVYAPPQQNTYPAQYPQEQFSQDPYPQNSASGQQAPRQGRMRQFFAATLAAVMQGSGASTTLGLSDMVAGGIGEWFDRKQRRKSAASFAPPTNYQQPAYRQETYRQETYPQPAPGYAPLPEYQPDAADPNAFAPQDSSFDGGDMGAQYAPVQYFDAQTGAPSSAEPAYFDTQAPLDDTLYAGMAYEVHTLAPGGMTQPVNPANHVFRTGDQFIVMYRPSLPGRMSVVNVNPAGRETEIDRIDIAAGQLLRLGPYRFESMQGDESLRFVITPCSSPALTLATRDIVRVNEVQTGMGLNLGGCNSLATRSIRAPRTRDIRKVAVEGTTGFAFDPVSPQELASGEFAPRQLTVMFRHR